MTSDAEKLVAIRIGDVVCWMEGRQEVSGIVDGFRLPSHPDKDAGHSVIVGRAGEKQAIVALSAILSRQRLTGVDRGTITF